MLVEVHGPFIPRLVFRQPRRYGVYALLEFVQCWTGVYAHWPPPDGCHPTSLDSCHAEVISERPDCRVLPRQSPEKEAEERADRSKRVPVRLLPLSEPVGGERRVRAHHRVAG